MKIENDIDLLAIPKHEIQAPTNRELKYIGSIKHHTGHTLFEINLLTGTIKQADIKRTAIVEPHRKITYNSRVTVNKHCYYLEALNIQNAKKKFLKLIKR